MGKLIPYDWRPTNDWDSHRPLLWLALEYSNEGRVLELGCGHGSTPLLEEYCRDHNREFVSLETNEEWASQFEFTIHVDQYMGAFEIKDHDFAVIFIDCAPGEIRKDLIEALKDSAEVLVIHDTERGADYVYKMAEVLDSFKYRVDLHIAGSPSTTAVSNKWRIDHFRGNWDEFVLI